MFVHNVLCHNDSQRRASRADPNPVLVVLESKFLLPNIKEVLKHKKIGALGVFSVNLLALELTPFSFELKSTDLCNKEMLKHK